MQPQRNVSLLEASILAGKDKSTIQKRLTHKNEDKRIIGEKDKNGEWIINLASLCQHYKISKENIQILEDKSSTPSIQRNTEQATPRNTEFNSNSTHEIIELRAEVKFLNQRLEDKKNEIERMNEREQKIETEKNRFVDMLGKKDNLLTFYQEKEVEQKPTPVVKKSYWGRGLIAASLIASLVIGGTIAVLSPEKLAFLKTNESQAVAAIPKTTPIINIEPAAGAPQITAQPSLSSSQENVR